MGWLAGGRGRPGCMQMQMHDACTQAATTSTLTDSRHGDNGNDNSSSSRQPNNYLILRYYLVLSKSN